MVINTTGLLFLRSGLARPLLRSPHWSRHDFLSPSVAHGRDGTEQQILVIKTTAELDPQSERYKKRVVEKLSAAARDYVTRSDRVRAFLFMNPMKDWCRVAEASRGRPRDEMIHQMHILKKAHAEAGRQ
jgi:hypothetical protein